MSNTKTKRGRPEKGLYMKGRNTALLHQSYSYEGKYAIYGLSSSEAPENMRYIGFTCQKLFKRYNSHITSAKNNRLPREQWMNQLLREGNQLVLIVLEDDILFYEQACDKEREYIRKFTEQGVELLNQTLGGPGILGFHHTEETRHKLAEVRKHIAAEKRKKEVPTGKVAEIKMQLAS